MQRNVGNIDSTLRISLGLALWTAVVAGAIGPWGLIGVIPLATGLLGNCPLYSALGFKTCSEAH